MDATALSPFRLLSADELQLVAGAVDEDNKLDEEGNIVKTTQVFPPSSDEKKGGLGGLAGKMVG